MPDAYLSFHVCPRIDGGFAYSAVERFGGDECPKLRRYVVDTWIQSDVTLPTGFTRQKIFSYTRTHNFCLPLGGQGSRPCSWGAWGPATLRGSDL
jgi:hypothetical protein